jgi:hypothetical protein
MSFESFLTDPAQEETPESPVHPSEASDSHGAAAEEEQFGWNDLIVPEEHLKVAEKKIQEMGFAVTTQEIPENRQYLDNDPTSQSFGEFVISITHSSDKKPVDRETLKEIMTALREGDTHVLARVARLAPGEHFG